MGRHLRFSKWHWKLGGKEESVLSQIRDDISLPYFNFLLRLVMSFAPTTVTVFIFLYSLV